MSKRCCAIVVALLFTLGISAGCKQQCFVLECDYDHYRGLTLNQSLDCTANNNIVADTYYVKSPSTVLDAEREPRCITLPEAISAALQFGDVGPQQQQSTGGDTLFGIDTTVQFTGRGLAGDSNIRVFSFDPAIFANDIEASLAKFDARWVTSMIWNTVDRPVGTGQDQLIATENFIKQQQATFRTNLLKPLPTGGMAGITFTTEYDLSNLRARVNPSYRPSIQFQFEQPLLQGFGVEINQLRATHPGSLLNPFNTGSRVEGILIARIRFDQQRAEFERQLNFLLLNVELAYWNLYGAYWTLYSQEQGMRAAFDAWRINKARFDAGRSNVADVSQSRGQYELFRGRRLAALGQVLENERQLRTLMGLPVEDGCRLVPVDSPTLTEFHPDWDCSMNEALVMRPELVLARHELKVRQLDLINQKNLLLPDLRFFSTYDFNGLGSRLDGPGPQNALASLTSFDFSNWQLGLRADIPLGYRDVHSQVRNARLQLSRSYWVLLDQELKIQRYLAKEYRQVLEDYQQITVQRAQREAFALQLKARYDRYLAGNEQIDFLLEAQRNWADALRTEYSAIRDYNKTLAAFQFSKGTLMQFDNVQISEGPLPQCAQLRAVEHQRERHSALELRERPSPNGPPDEVAEAPSPERVPVSLAAPLKVYPIGRRRVPEIGAITPQEQQYFNELQLQPNDPVLAPDPTLAPETGIPVAPRREIE